MFSVMGSLRAGVVVTILVLYCVQVGELLNAGLMSPRHDPQL